MIKKIATTAAVLLLSIHSIEAQKLVILHTNDTHSQIEQMRVGPNKGLGGVERRLQLFDSLVTKYGRQRVLIVDAGDFNQGTPYFTMCGGALEMDLVNELGYEVLTLGNHEFDNGVEDLANRLSKAEYQTVVCNYDFSGTALKKYIKPYAIVRRGGMKIGIIGAAPNLDGLVSRKMREGVKPLNTVKQVNSWADYLKKKKHCDLVILLSHLGFSGGNIEHPSDIVMVENSRNIDLVIGGHSHTYLKEAREVGNLDGITVPIVQCGGQGCIVGKFEIF